MLAPREFHVPRPTYCRWLAWRGSCCPAMLPPGIGDTSGPNESGTVPLMVCNEETCVVAGSVDGLLSYFVKVKKTHFQNITQFLRKHGKVRD